MGFIENIYEKAKADVKTIAVPECENEYVLKASAKAVADGIVNVIFVGDPEKVKAASEKYGVDVSAIKIADINDEAYKQELLEKYDASPYKVMSKKFVEKRINEPLYI